MTHPIHLALEQARAAGARGEVPVGCVIVEHATGAVLAARGNETEAMHNPCAHAEMLAIIDACEKTGAPRLPQCDIYVTLEPCTMCATAISFARMRKLVFGAYDPKGGGVEHGARFYRQSTCHHAPTVIGGLEEAECSALIKAFFEAKR